MADYQRDAGGNTTNILIMDPDLGFVFWLGHLLEAAGYQSLPAKDVARARALINRFNVGINLVIIGHSLEDVGDFVETLRRTQKELQVIYLYGESEEPRSSPGGDVWVCKPSSPDQMSEAIWLEMVQDIFKRRE
jgi:DNA-binding response OmpR family regulator